VRSQLPATRLASCLRGRLHGRPRVSSGCKPLAWPQHSQLRQPGNVVRVYLCSACYVRPSLCTPSFCSRAVHVGVPALLWRRLLCARHCAGAPTVCEVRHVRWCACKASL
jgi:hypothetical protein